jgi:hypothetical protein
LTEQTAVEFTQAGKRQTFSAGYIIGISPFGMRVSGLRGEIHFNSSLVTSLGIVFVDQEYHDAMERWRKAMAVLVDPPAYTDLRVELPLGNKAEF